MLGWLKQITTREPRNVVLVYVDGCDLHDVAEPLEKSFREFVDSREWKAQQVTFVNNRQTRNPQDAPEDLPGWDLGLNFTIPTRNERDETWFEDLQATVDFVSALNAEFDRDFVIAVHDRSRGYNEDVAFIESTPPDLAEIKYLIDCHRA